ncbi:RHS repeat-associated protein [Pseudomonas lini]|uniref:RHS repeat-associated core domain-containing protein n=1 Tax=Pseudomonas lini TaxID=163011 RepID=UPI002782A6BE|nr:RHS repeat-associated core domain-containing protein [Pseudomonas lini]MDQ0125887.1 RHS repeat-associated protein [Pseudomonas lini]
MPTSPHEILLVRYRYDPLDRTVYCAPFDHFAIQRFYCRTRLATEIQGAVQRSIVQHDDQLLAQQRNEGTEVAVTLLATDQQRSVLNALDANQPHSLAYTPYGHRPPKNGLLGLLGFNGERPDPVTGHYHLGNGYRQFNPVLMRFNSPDSWSPFGKGGLNAYAYCEGDPGNLVDPTGHVGFRIPIIPRRANPLRTMSNSSRSISRSSAATGNVNTQAASSTAATATTVSGSTNTVSTASIANNTDAAIPRIKQNESIAEITGAYTRRIEVRSIIQSPTLYREAQKNYHFVPVRHHPNVYVPAAATPAWTNNGQLDMHPFDISISHFRNVADLQNHLIPGSGRHWSTIADALEIRRANHIHEYTGINLYRQ